MNNSELIQPHHKDRKAVIYIRQSTGHQVLTNVESQKIQRAMRENARRLGWDEGAIEVVETDLGLSAKSTEGREGYKRLLSDVALGRVGLVLSYESTRLSRNCTDWYPLLDLCAAEDCLIADRDGVYDPSSANGRMLLGMKGILSEMELHTLRGRLLAGIQSKAKRGDLALALPAGLVRQEDGSVVKDPDLQVQQAIDVVFDSFVKLKTAAKVLRHFRDKHLTIPKRHRNDETVWCAPSLSKIIGVLKNPAYAGAFVYGKTKTINTRGPDGMRQSQKRKEIDEWSVIVQDRYPGYISWETFLRIQSMLKDNYAEYDRNKSRGAPRDGDALLQGLVYCGECGHKMAVQYKTGARYLCNHYRQQQLAPVCQLLPAEPIDRFVIGAFFEALSVAELNLYEKAMAERHQLNASADLAKEREIQRLRYQSDLARRRYEKVDPANRLVAGELERRWEEALRALGDAERRFEQERDERDKVVPLRIPNALKDAFSSLGESLPELWETATLSRSQRKALLRCLIDNVVLRRKENREQVCTRIVWRGGAVTEKDVSVPVGSLRDMGNYDQLEGQILTLESEGKSDDEIAAILTQAGFRSAQSDQLLRSTVQTIRLKHGRIHRFWSPRPRRVKGYLTLPQVAEKVGVKPHWIYHLIDTKIIRINKDENTGLYLFPDNKKTIDDFRRLKTGSVERLDY
jgi:DNA invertase Pin-like site-specific DNA recombinase/predicted DNA-binding transcriptional regulator AlpA